MELNYNEDLPSSRKSNKEELLVSNRSFLDLEEELTAPRGALTNEKASPLKSGSKMSNSLN